VEGGVGVMMINYEPRYGLKARMNEDGFDQMSVMYLSLTSGHKWVFVKGLSDGVL
jgi:hypothetical protein